LSNLAAPDARGYGGSDKPEAIRPYSMKEMRARLITGIGQAQAIVD
jgi:pimeloyl-ACP methyl ester carboxylesterase